jgi:DNA-binding NarL/FixJ family response regulator
MVETDGRLVGERREELVRGGRWAAANETVLQELSRTGTADVLKLVHAPRSGSPRPPRAGEVSPGRLAAARAITLATSGDGFARAVAHAEEALDLGGRHDPDCFWDAMLVFLYAEDLQRVERECLALAPSARHREVVPLLQARVLALSGAPRKAHGLLSEIVKRTRSPMAVAWLTEVLAELGEIDRGTELLQKFGFPGSAAHTPERAHLLAARGALRLAAGRFRQALDDLFECGRLLTAQGIFNPAVAPWRSQAALCASALQRDDVAAALAHEEVAAAERWGTPWGRAVALHALAIVRDDEHSMERLQSAVALAAEPRNRGDRVRMCYDLAVLLDERRVHDKARSVLAMAEEAAKHGGNALWADRINRARLRIAASGERPGPLSGQELTVAKLARAGHSNKEIADRLKLTARTVERHLSSVYRKLDLAGRADLTFALSALRGAGTPAR